MNEQTEEIGNMGDGLLDRGFARILSALGWTAMLESDVSFGIRLLILGYFTLLPYVLI